MLACRARQGKHDGLVARRPFGSHRAAVWAHSGRLPHVLSPRAYVDAAQLDAELAAIFRPAWHWVGLAGDWSRDGDQRAFDLLGTPVVVRRGGGRLRAFVNVCVHRHSTLAPLGATRADALVCPYHGFRYHEDGRVAHVPCAHEMAGAGPRWGRLAEIALEARAGLVFVSLAPHPAPLEEALDAATRALVDRAFSPSHRVLGRYRFEAHCNWKVPLENVLETYHVASLHENVLARHPEVFRLFTGHRGEGAVHRLGALSTSYHDTMGADSRAYLRIAEALRPGAHARYEHVHAFPHLVVADTHLVSFVQTVRPLGPERCVVEAALVAPRGASLFSRAAAPAVGLVASRFMRKVLAEDASIYERVQAGLRASPHDGVLSPREERVHALQCFVRDRAGDVGRP
jgi:phenylpropionate dioxygenase-like ring-hydroxylating dioxygenase large terminal subunit